MAFNFNWSPLTADAGFYERATELLTTALNKSPKPAIIVDDIVVTELSLGNDPPELEILEIGDLAEDRFRGIFKMSFSGDAYLTLRTRVQANPLNTYLLTRPRFASPQPLAAATGLTIPLQITLSDIKLNGFVVLVFSRQKGLTLVFRNDPLESLKVSSTFDSIPFVRDHLQKEIEGQLRVLLMDELPAIIHRLSLRLWVPEHGSQVERKAEPEHTPQEDPVDPLATPPLDAVDSSGNPLNPAEIASLSLDSGIETQALFSRKNLLRLATLDDSHRTLSLFTPQISSVVYRAWAGPTEHGEFASGLHTPALAPTLSRSHSYAGSMSTTYTFSDHSVQTRPTLQSFGSSTYGSSMSAGRNAKVHGARKRKTRVVNLRKQPETGETELISEDGSTMTDSASVTESTSSAPSVFSPVRPTSSGHTEADVVTPPISPNGSVKAGKNVEHRQSPLVGVTLEPPERPSSTPVDPFDHDRIGPASASLASTGPEGTLRARRLAPQRSVEDLDATPRASMYLPDRNSAAYKQNQAAMDTKPHQSESSSASGRPPLPNFLQFVNDPANGGSIAEQAWMAKMANELAKRYQEEKEKGSFGEEREGEAPPAYAQ